MRTLSLALLAVLSMIVLSSCEDGGTGPHPGLELKYVDADGYQYNLFGNVFVNADTVGMIQMPYDTLEFGRTSFTLSVRPDRLLFNVLKGMGNLNFASSSVTIDLPSPIAEGSYPWTSPVNVTQKGFGAHVSLPKMGGEPVSGTTVITKVYRDRNGTVTGVAGYCNGTIGTLDVNIAELRVSMKTTGTLQSCIFDSQLPTFNQ